jgi:hypothetical protein
MFDMVLGLDSRHHGFMDLSETLQLVTAVKDRQGPLSETPHQVDPHERALKGASRRKWHF